MRKFKTKYDLVLFALLMAFLFTPLIQEWTGVIPVKPLKGVFEPTEKPKLTLDAYRSNTYQTQMEKHVSENFGLREPVIRLYNQYVWTAYNKTYCHFIVPGKKGYLFYAQAVDEHFGKEVLKHYKSNEEAIADADRELRLMNKLRYVLKDYGIEFLAFLAPDKPEIFPEYLPRRDADTTTVHLADYYKRRMTETDFPFVDMTQWFVTMKDTVSFPLFPKTDSHWRYSAIYGYDSLFRFINALDGEAKFPPIHIGPPVAYESDELEGDEETLNLIFRIRGDNIKYKSEITVETDTLHRKPKVLFVGDSFIWSMETFLPFREMMADKEIWFYNNTAFVGFNKKSMNVPDINRLSHILHADYVVFYSAGHQWREATYGFARDALLQLCVSDSLFDATVTRFADSLHGRSDYCDLTDEEMRENMSWLLKNNPELIPGLQGEEMPTIRNKKGIETARCINELESEEGRLQAISMYATQQSISLNEALEAEAQRKLAGEPLLSEGITFDSATFIQMKKAEIMEQWRHNPEMTKMIQQKAKERNLTFEVMLEKDAQWVIDRQIENGELFK